MDRDDTTPAGYTAIIVYRKGALKDLVTEEGDKHYFSVKKFKMRFYKFVTQAFKELGREYEVSVGKCHNIIKPFHVPLPFRLLKVNLYW